MKAVIIFSTICAIGVSSHLPQSDLNTQWKHPKVSHLEVTLSETEIQKLKQELYEKSNDFEEFALVSDIPDAVDWREKGAVTAVKNQGICAAWAYGVTGALEGQNFLKTGNLIALSEQELADCVTENGCNNGTVEDGYKYVIEHGLTAEADYPHLDDGSCHRRSIPSAVTESAYVSVDNNEEILRRAVAAVGPISVGVNARAWETYTGGIFKCHLPVSINHMALLVGYGSEDGVDYWLVKNSWGESWGEKGYIRVERNLEGDCGITLSSTYPVV